MIWVFARPLVWCDSRYGRGDYWEVLHGDGSGYGDDVCQGDGWKDEDGDGVGDGYGLGNGLGSGWGRS